MLWGDSPRQLTGGKISRGGGVPAEGELPEEVVLAGHRSEEGGLETLLATNLGSVESRP